MPKRHALGYRLEFWPRSEQAVRAMLLRAGLRSARTLRMRRQEAFASSDELYNFYAAMSASWWLTTVPADRVDEVSRTMRRGFARRSITHLTMGVALAYDVKPA